MPTMAHIMVLLYVALAGGQRSLFGHSIPRVQKGHGNSSRAHPPNAGCTNLHHSDTSYLDVGAVLQQCRMHQPPSQWHILSGCGPSRSGAAWHIEATSVLQSPITPTWRKIQCLQQGAPNPLPGYYSGVTWVLPGYYLGITWVLPGYYLGITWVLLGYYLGITWVLPGYYSGVTWVLPGYYSGIRHFRYFWRDTCSRIHRPQAIDLYNGKDLRSLLSLTVHHLAYISDHCSAWLHIT